MKHLVKSLLLLVCFLIATSLIPISSANAATYSLSPTADAFVDQSLPNNNYGPWGTLRAQGSPIMRSYFKFTVSNLGGAPISNAVFEIYANGSNSSGFELRSISDNSWSESLITFNNAPVAGNVIVSSGSHSGARYIGVNVSNYIQSEGTYSFVLTTNHNPYRSYPSKELGSNPPRLVITTGTITVTPTPTLTPTPTPTTGVTATPTPTPTPTSPPVDSGVNLSDALELYANSKTNADYGFEKVIQYYGLKRKDINLATTTLTDALLKDESGNYFKTVHVDAAVAHSYLDTSELSVLRNAVQNGVVNVILTALRANSNAAVNYLTNGEITGSKDVADTVKDFKIQSVQPEVTKEFTGLTVNHSTDPLDYALTIAGSAPRTTILIKATDSSNSLYNLFARYQNGSGSIFVLSNFADSNLKNSLLRDILYYRASGAKLEQRWFAEIMPVFMFVKYTAGDEVWHNNTNYANFTLDDPYMRTADFNYAGILNSARQPFPNNFHFTLAMPPARSTPRDASVVDLFKNNPNYLSVVMHGNNHDGYEFYKYTTTSSDPYPARPYADQVADINQGLARYSTFNSETGIPWTRAMVFPYNISPTQTLVYLKQNNFQATLNSLDVAIDATKSTAWDSHVYPAEMAYGNFPSIIRFHANNAPYAFDLFFDKPSWSYEHKEVFANNINWMNPIAARINSTVGGVTWQSIDYILKRMYLEKTNDDGSVSVMMFGNNILITNTGGARTFRVQRKETQNVPIKSVTVNGSSVSYTVNGGLLQSSFVIGSGATADFKITYGL